MESSKEQDAQLKSWKEKEKLAKSIESVSSKWEIISTQVKEHRDNVSKVLTIVSDHSESIQSINEVITQGEKMLNSTPPGVFDVEKGHVHLKQLRVSKSLAYLMELLFHLCLLGCFNICNTHPQLTAIFACFWNFIIRGRGN